MIFVFRQVTEPEKPEDDNSGSDIAEVTTLYHCISFSMIIGGNLR